MFKKNKIIKSANFKKDYIAFFAIFFFCFIVFAELSVIIGIPIVINHTQIYADFEVRHELIKAFDSTRSWAGAVASKNLPTSNEAKLILWDLDQLALFLRENQREVKMDCVVEMLQDIQKYRANLQKLSSAGAKSYLQQKEIDFELLKKNINNPMEQ